MESIQFEWDENKNRINQHKHGISFLEAKTVFYDEEALVIDDPEHSEQEDRFIILGLSSRANLLVVCHCYRASSVLSRPERPQKLNRNIMESEVCVMLKEYDFSNARKNPYAKVLKKQITINIDSNTIDYFKEQAEVVGIPYQTLINLYLKDCVANNRHLSLSWQ